MVTVSPTLGIGPLPSAVVVLVTSMIAFVVVKVRDVVEESLVRVLVHRRCGNCRCRRENMYARSVERTREGSRLYMRVSMA